MANLTHHTTDEMHDLRIRLLRTEIVLGALLSSIVALLMCGFVQIGGAPLTAGNILHARAIVIDDQEGRARIVLGAPTPDVPGRARTEPVYGLLLLGPNGSDRIVLSYPGLEPQVMGKVGKRSVAIPSAGIIINDSAGDERAGLGVSDDGARTALGLDYRDRDAMGLLVSPGYTGLVAFARNGERNDQITLGVRKDGTAQFKLADTAGDEHFMMEAMKGVPPRFQVMNPATEKLQDVTKKLVP